MTVSVCSYQWQRRVKQKPAFPNCCCQICNFLCGFAGTYWRILETWAPQVYFLYWTSSRSRRGSKDVTGQYSWDSGRAFPWKAQCFAMFITTKIEHYITLYLSLSIVLPAQLERNPEFSYPFVCAPHIVLSGAKITQTRGFQLLAGSHYQRKPKQAAGQKSKQSIILISSWPCTYSCSGCS